MSIHHNQHNQPLQPKNASKINSSLNKQQKFNYLEHSFQKSLQRSYDRRDRSSQRKRFSPPSLQSPIYNNATLKFTYNSPPKDKAEPFHLDIAQRSSHQRSSQFSPYQNRQGNVRDKIMMHQIKKQNQILGQKVAQYEHMFDQMHIQLKLKNDQLSTLGQMLQKEKIVTQQVTNQMKEQISVLLSKNTMLQKKILVLQRQIKDLQRSKSAIQCRSRSISVSAQTNNKLNANIVYQLKQLLTIDHSNKGYKASKQRDSGKLLNLTHSFNNSLNVSPQNQKSDRQNISMQFKTGYDQNIDPMIIDLKDKIGRLHKFQELINSVLQMYHKIMGGRISVSAGSCRSSQMKTIWKWLKTLGHNYNIVNKWKKVLIECLNKQNKALTCTKVMQEEPIEDIFQKIVLLLHQNKY